MSLGRGISSARSPRRWLIAASGTPRLNPPPERPFSLIGDMAVTVPLPDGLCEAHGALTAVAQMATATTSRDTDSPCRSTTGDEQGRIGFHLRAGEVAEKLLAKYERSDLMKASATFPRRVVQILSRDSADESAKGIDASSRRARS